MLFKIRPQELCNSRSRMDCQGISNLSLWRVNVKKILFLGREEDEAALCELIRGHQELQLNTVKNARKLARVLKEDTPDFVMFAGQIQLNQDGSISILL